MKVVIEVIATNMVSGHIAISQETVDIDQTLIPATKRKEHTENLIKMIKASEAFSPKKVGDVLIIRNATLLA